MKGGEMLENELHPLGAIAIAEARGQSGPEVLEEIVLKKFAKANEVLNRSNPGLSDDCEVSGEENKKLIFDPGTCSI